MAKKNKKKSSDKGTTQPIVIDSLAHDLEDLLRTVRRIAFHEDELCTLAQAARNHDESDVDLLKDVKALLKALERSRYNDEVTALQVSIASLRTAGNSKAKSKAAKKK